MKKRTVYVDDDVWEKLKDYYRVNGLDLSKAIRAYMATDLRRLVEQGLIEETPLNLAQKETPE